MHHRIELLKTTLKQAYDCAGKPDECRKRIDLAQAIVKEMMEPPVVVRHTHRELVEIVDSMT